jgi:hypothetical protein
VFTKKEILKGNIINMGNRKYDLTVVRSITVFAFPRHLRAMRIYLTREPCLRCSQSGWDVLDLIFNIPLYFMFLGLILNLYPQHGHKRPGHSRNI